MQSQSKILSKQKTQNKRYICCKAKGRLTHCRVSGLVGVIRVGALSAAGGREGGLHSLERAGYHAVAVGFVAGCFDGTVNR